MRGDPLPLDTETMIEILELHIPDFDDYSVEGDAEATAQAIMDDLRKVLPKRYTQPPGRPQMTGPVIGPMRMIGLVLVALLGLAFIAFCIWLIANFKG